MNVERMEGWKIGTDRGRLTMDGGRTCPVLKYVYRKKQIIDLMKPLMGSRWTEHCAENRNRLARGREEEVRRDKEAED